MRPLLQSWPLALAATWSLASPSAQTPDLRSFYAQTSVSNGDDIVSVEPIGADVRIRVIRVENLDEICPAMRVEAVEHILRNTTVEAVAAAPMCSITDRLVAQSLLRAPDRQQHVDFVNTRDAVVATCATRERLFTFRQPPPVDRDTLRRIAPGVAAIWDAGVRIEKQVAPPGADDPFSGDAAAHAAMTTMGTALVAELVSDKYATAFGDGYFAKRLKGYTAPTASLGPLPAELAERDTLGLVSYAAPAMPAIAIDARVFGDVRLKLTIDASGAVTDVTPLSGNKLHVPAAVDAARQWRFAPEAAPRVLEVTVQFQLRCRT